MLQFYQTFLVKIEQFDQLKPQESLPTLPEQDMASSVGKVRIFFACLPNKLTLKFKTGRNCIEIQGLKNFFLRQLPKPALPVFGSLERQYKSREHLRRVCSNIKLLGRFRKGYTSIKICYRQNFSEIVFGPFSRPQRTLQKKSL